MRGTFGNIRLRNPLAGRQGGQLDRAPADRRDHARSTTPRALPGGRAPRWSSSPAREYGTGSSPRLGRQGHAAARRPRGHRRSRSSASTAATWSGMGVLPLQFREGEGHDELGLTGRETFDLTGLAELQPRERGRGRLHPRGRLDGRVPGARPRRRPHRAAVPAQRRHPAHRAAAPLPGEHRLLIPRPAGADGPRPGDRCALHGSG